MRSTKKKATTTKREMVTYKDVIILFLSEGLSAVEKQVEAGKLKPATVRRAAEDLKTTAPSHAESLLAFVDKVKPPRQGRGRPSPQAGDNRDYKAQKIGTHEPFLRLPLGALGVKKGQVVTVRFSEDRLTVLKKAS